MGTANPTTPRCTSARGTDVPWLRPRNYRSLIAVTRSALIRDRSRSVRALNVLPKGVIADGIGNQRDPDVRGRSGDQHTRGRRPRGPRLGFVLRRNSTAARQETRFARISGPVAASTARNPIGATAEAPFPRATQGRANPRGQFSCSPIARLTRTPAERARYLLCSSAG